MMCVLEKTDSTVFSNVFEIPVSGNGRELVGALVEDKDAD
jgi:hypothetical protein